MMTPLRTLGVVWSLAILGLGVTQGCKPMGAPRNGVRTGSRHCPGDIPGTLKLCPPGYGVVSGPAAGPPLPFDRFSNSVNAADVAGGDPNKARLNDPRQDATATTLFDGTVLITGGSTIGTAQATAEIYTPSSGEFTYTVDFANGKQSKMSAARRLHTATRLDNGHVVFIGGVGQNNEPMREVEEYDPNTGVFEKVEALPAEARAGHTATLLPSTGEILVVGGCTRAVGGQPGTQNFQGWAPTARVDLYDPTTRRWNVQTSPLAQNRKAGVPAGQIAASPKNTRFFHAAVRAPSPNGGDLVVLFGGLSTPGQTFIAPAPGPIGIQYMIAGEIEVFNYNTNAWDNAGAMGKPRVFAAVTTINTNPEPGNFDFFVACGSASTTFQNFLTHPTPGLSMHDDGVLPSNVLEVYRLLRSTNNPQQFTVSIITGATAGIPVPVQVPPPQTLTPSPVAPPLPSGAPSASTATDAAPAGNGVFLVPLNIPDLTPTDAVAEARVLIGGGAFDWNAATLSPRAHSKAVLVATVKITNTAPTRGAIELAWAGTRADGVTDPNVLVPINHMAQDKTTDMLAKFDAIGEMHESRAFAIVAVMPGQDGRFGTVDDAILIAGGDSGSVQTQTLSSAEIYDPRRDK